MLKHLRTSYPIIFGILILFLGVFAGEYFGWYYRIPNLDKVFHVAGGAAVAWFILALMQDEITHMHWWKQALIFVSVATFVGIVWEWAEYLANATVTSAPWFYRYFHGGDLADTLGDLAADTAGALALTLWALWNERA